MFDDNNNGEKMNGGEPNNNKQKMENCKRKSEKNSHHLKMDVKKNANAFGDMVAVIWRWSRFESSIFFPMI